MTDGDLLEAARECRRLASVIRVLCADAGDLDSNYRCELSALVSGTVLDLDWILGRNYGADTIVAEVSIAAEMLPDAAVIVDVGANAGQWSRTALQLFPQANVLAFEPQHTHAAHLSSLQTEFSSRFSYSELALSDESGTAQFYSNEDGSGLASLYKRDLLRFYNVDMKEVASIKTSTLAVQAKRFGLSGIDILKIDVEGHELSVLKGAVSIISKIKYIQFEFGGAMMDSKVSFRDFMAFFADLPFKLYRISPIGLIALPGYNEGLEGFEMSNYVAINNSINYIK